MASTTFDGANLQSAGWRRRAFLAALTDYSARYGAIVLLVAMVVYFTIRDPRFVSIAQLTNLAQSAAPLGILAGGVTVMLVLLDFDLSVAFSATLAATIATVLATSQEKIWAAVGAALVAGLAVGVINGIAVSRLRMPAFITTLAMGGVLLGLSYKIGGFNPIASTPQFSTFGRGVVLGVPNIFVVMVIELLLLWVFLEHTALGRSMYAIGGNPMAARMRGVNIPNTRLFAFVLMGLLAGLAGILQASYLGSMSVGTFPGNYLLDTITAVFIGMAVLRPGQFHILGTFIGLILLVVLSNGMGFVGVGYEFQSLVKGAVLILAVAFARLVRVR
jgi:ribose transport system permease protein